MTAAGPAPEPTAFLHARMPLAATLGMRAQRLAKDETVLQMPWAASLCTSGGILHGGALMALADTCGAVCAFLNLPPGAATSTIESKTNFIRGVRDGEVVATARPLHVGSSTIVIETELHHRGRLAAKILQTQAVLQPRTDSSAPPQE